METKRISTQISSSPIFVSHKQVKCLPMTRGDYNIYQGWKTPENEDVSDEGYLVEYLDGGKPNHADHEGYISWTPKEQFDNGYIEQIESDSVGKTLHNSDISGTKKNVPDVEVVGNGDMFQLLCKASSEKEGWMKSTKAMQIDFIGCVVQVTTQQKNLDGSYSLAEAVTFVPKVKIVDDENNGRKLVEY